MTKEEQLQKWREAAARWREKNREYERERSKQNYRDNIEYYRNAARTKYQTDPDYFKDHLQKKPVSHEYTLYHHAKSRSKKLGLDFNLEVTDVIIPEFCPILSIPLFQGKGKPCNNSPSLDRVNNTKGYLKGNVRVISYAANRMKCDMTPEHIERLYLYSKGDL